MKLIKVNSTFDYLDNKLITYFPYPMFLIFGSALLLCLIFLLDKDNNDDGGIIFSFLIMMH